MSEQQKKSTEGPPIWVESLLSSDEYSTIAIKYPKAFTKGTKPVQFGLRHKGGKWWYKMGGGYSAEEIITFNKIVDELHIILKKIQDEVRIEGDNTQS